MAQASPSAKKTVVTCLLCGKAFARLSSRHLAKHGLTRAQYLVTFALKPSDIGDATPTSVYTAAVGLASTEQAQLKTLTDQVVAELVKSGELARRVSPEVEKQILTNYKTQVAAACMALVESRLKMHGKAVALLEDARSQLSEKWRLEQGGENGGPTPIPHLVSIVHSALAEMKTGEELLVKTLKLAIDEQKSVEAAPPNFGKLTVDALKTLPIPDALDSSQRENMRKLMDVFGRGLKSGAIVDAAARVVPTREDPLALLPPPVEIPAPTPPAPEPAGDRLDAATEF